MERYTPQDYDAVFAELDGANDRAAILVAGSLLDHALAEAIMSRLREPPTAAGWDEIFDDGGIVNTFSQKIMTAYFLKIIGPVARRDFDLIRKIRNEAAHNMNPVSFDNSPKIASRVRELTMGNENTIQLALRQRFLVAVRMYYANLILRAGDSNAEIAEASRALAQFLDR